MLKGLFPSRFLSISKGLAFVSLLKLVIACNSPLPDSTSNTSPTPTTSDSGMLTGPSGNLSFTITGPTVIAAGVVGQINLNVTDSAGHPGVISTITAKATGGTSLGMFGGIYMPEPGQYVIPYRGKRVGTPNNIQLVINGKIVQTKVNISVVPGNLEQLDIIGGNNQNAPISTQLPTNPQIRALDVQGNPIPNLNVTFLVQSGNGLLGTGTSLNVITDADGKANVPWTMGSAYGANTLIASSGAISSTFNAYAYDTPLATPVIAINLLNEIDLAWMAGYDGGGPLTYTVFRGTAANGPFTAIASKLTGLTYKDTTVTSPTTYYYYVVTNNTFVNSAPSNTVSGNPIFNYFWKTNSTYLSQFTYDNTKIDFTSTSCELTVSGQSDSDSTTTGFGGGTANGLVYGLLSDGTSNGIKLGNTGVCNGGSTNCQELDSTWAPEWSNLVGYWKLNESAGASSVVDSSPIGTNSGTPTSVTFGTAAKLRTGATFNGTNSYISIPNSASLSIGTGSVTVSAWINSSNVAANYGMILAKLGASGSNYELRFNGTSGKLQFVVNTSIAVSGNTLLVAGNWYHVVATYNGSTASLYINGVLDTATAFTGTPITNSNAVTIGKRSDGYPFAGIIDEVAIWNTPLSATEVRSIYDRQWAARSGSFISRIMDGHSTGQAWTSLSWAPTLPFLKELPDAISGTPQQETTANYSSLSNSTLMNSIVGLRHLNEAAGTTGAGSVIDSSGNGNNATPTGVTFGGTGKFKTAASMSGSTGNIIVANTNAGNFTSSAFTISEWVYLNSFTTNLSGQGPVTVFKGGNSVGGYYAQIASAGNYISFVTSQSGAYQVTGASAAIPLGQWNHFVFVRNGASVRIYVNGVDKTSSVGTHINPTSSTTALSFGNYISGANNNYIVMNGSLDEIAVWGRNLSLAEVQQLYQRGASRIRFQVRSCTTSNCSDAPTWHGPDGTSNTYFSELYHMSTQSATPSGTVLATAPSLSLQSYTSPVAANRYFQYRALFESDSTTASLMPELKSVAIGPNHYDSTSPTVVSKNGVTFNNLSAILEAGTTTCPGGVTYNLSLDKVTWYYWNTSASPSPTWAIADGTVAKSNSASVISGAGVISSFSSTVGKGTVYFKAFLNSSGTNPCSLQGVQMNGN